MLQGFQGVRRKKKMMQLFTGLFLLALIFWAAEGVWGQYKKNRVIKEAYVESQARLTALLERGEDLEKQLENLSTERGIEEELRTKFHVAKPGEKTVVIVDSKVQKEEEKNEGGLWGSIKSFFGW